jgi:FtsH ternary system-associated peptide
VALGFRDSEALQVVLTSGLCPADVLGSGARVAYAADGALVLDPEQPVPRAALGRLRAVGVVVDAELPDDIDARAVACWAEAIMLEPVALPEIPSLVLFVTRRADELIDLAAELVRLGCDRQELLVTDDGGVLRVVDAPTYTVQRALDLEGGLRGFAPSPANQDAVWTELGYRHPLADRLQAAPGTLALLGRDRWRTLADDGWVGVDAALALTVPAAPIVRSAAPAWTRRTVELRLAGGRRGTPSLWVVRQAGVAAVDALLAYLPEDVVARLTFAVATGDEPAEPLVIVRARGGRHAPPELVLPAETYAPLAEMPDVYSPSGATVEPPLRRERLRQILGATGGDVLWLAALADRRFRVERIADSAFQPLSEWADYVLHASAPAFAPWLRATELAFAPFVSTGLEWASGPPRGEDEPIDDRRKRPRAPRAPAPAPTMLLEVPIATPDATPEPPLAARATAPVREVSVDAELIALEIRFIELDAPGDAPDRLALLERLGIAYARLGRRRDAGLCFVRAVWEARGADATARLDAWIAADGGLAGRGALERIVAQSSPDPDDVRVVAAATAHGARGTEPHRVQRWLDGHDGELDARTQWLSRIGLAQRAGGDALGLAHTRDRILARLAVGLSVEHELPAFLRVAGRIGALGSASGEHLSRALEDLVQRIGRTRRKRSPTEAPAQYTGAYVQLQLAHGFARIGAQPRARALAAEAHAALAPVASDPVHAYLAAAFTARIEQAIAGVASETPLSEALGAQLAALDRVGRYKVDRLREASRILEPLERPDAIGAFSRRQHDARGPEIEALRGIADLRARARAIAAVVETAARSEPDRERLLDGALDVLLELPEAQAAPILARAWPLIAQLPEVRRAVLYADALVVAGHFGRTELLPELLTRLGAAIRVVAGADLERVLQHSLRALRRIGLRTEIARLLADAEHALPEAGPIAMNGRLALAAGLAYLGDAARALPILAQASKALNDEFQALNEPRRDVPRTLMRPLELTRALSLAYAYAPLGNALAGITELATHLRDITDNFGTNSHYCLSVLHFVESLVLGITSEDLAIGEAGRRFIEDDEHLIRRRLHRDMGGTP